jgi:AcrR family transcriptional regulator
VKHDPEAMLDAACALVLTGGPAAATARAVAQAIGAPSGSVYHRFPARDDLVAAAWLRAQDRFLEAYLAAVRDTGQPPGVAAAVRVLTWSADHSQDAGVLLRFGLADLVRRDISPALRARAAVNQQRVEEAIRELGRLTGRNPSEVVLAVVDLPYSITRRVLREQRRPTDEEIAALARAAGLLTGSTQL